MSREFNPRIMPAPRHLPLAMPDQYPYVDGAAVEANQSYKADVCIIGSGAGGGSLAYYLTELGLKVIVLESGPATFTQTYSQEPARAYLQLYQEFGVLTTDLPPFLPIMGAEALGGSTVVNSGLCFRPEAYVMDDWRRQSGVDWFNRATLDPDLEWVENYLMVAPGSEQALGRHNTITRDAAEKLGWRGAVARRNAPGCIGCGVCYYGCPSGGKRSVDTSYLSDAAAMGLQIITRARVETLTRDKTGAVTQISGRFMAVNKEPRALGFTVDAPIYVLAAGAVGTPSMLMRNGFDNEHIGKHWHIHPGAGLSAWFWGEEIRQWDGITQGYYIDEFIGEGILMEVASVPTEAISAAFTAPGPAGLEAMRKLRHMATLGGMIHDKTEGWFKLLPGGAIVRRYQLNDSDIALMQRSVNLMAQLYDSVGANEYQVSINGADAARSVTEVAAQVARANRPEDWVLYCSHPQSTARMNVDAKMGAVGPDFRLHGCPNLYVSDASIFADSLGVNPQITIMALARRCARQIAHGKA